MARGPALTQIPEPEGAVVPAPQGVTRYDTRYWCVQDAVCVIGPLTVIVTELSVPV